MNILQDKGFRFWMVPGTTMGNSGPVIFHSETPNFCLAKRRWEARSHRGSPGFDFHHRRVYASAAVVWHSWGWGGGEVGGALQSSENRRLHWLAQQVDATLQDLLLDLTATCRATWRYATRSSLTKDLGHQGKRRPFQPIPLGLDIQLAVALQCCQGLVVCSATSDGTLERSCLTSSTDRRERRSELAWPYCSCLQRTVGWRPKWKRPASGRVGLFMGMFLCGFVP